MSDLSKMSNAELADHISSEVAAMCLAPSGVAHGETWHAFNWSDKPHRVLYDALSLLREAASRLQAPAVAEVEGAIGTLPAVAIRSVETMPNGDAHLVSQAWVHEGCVIEIRGTNDKAIGWIDTHEWLFGSVYRHHLLPALRTGGSE